MISLPDYQENKNLCLLTGDHLFYAFIKKPKAILRLLAACTDLQGLIILAWVNNEMIILPESCEIVSSR
jgi:hypothetical protein